MDIRQFNLAIEEHPWLRPLILDRGDSSLVDQWVVERLRFLEFRPWAKLLNHKVQTRMYAYAFEEIKNLHTFLYFKLVKYGVIYHLDGESIGKHAMLVRSGSNSLNLEETIDLLLTKGYYDINKPKADNREDERCSHIDAVMEITEKACLTSIYTESIIVYTSPEILLRKKG